MSRFVIKLNQGRCIGCRACEVQCQVRNDAAPGVKPGVLVAPGPERGPAVVQAPAAFRPCFHCEKPWCAAACPTGAMARRPQDGLVAVSRKLCIGCRACIAACPWKVPQWDETAGKVVKCDLCHERVAGGLQPACVAGCSTHALTFSRANENVRRVRALYAKSVRVDRGEG
jgi:Fe-S-cluster-containing dehydrogenase component